MAGQARQGQGLPRDRASRAAVVPVLSNAFVLVLKAVVGLMTGSIAVLSDAMDSLEDVGASLFDLWSVRLSAKPADQEHPYGHGKVEGIAATAEGLLIGGGGVFIFYQAIHRLISGQAEIGVGLGLVAMIVTAFVNLGVVFHIARAAKETGSLVLTAASRHLWTNVAQAIAVITALVLVGLTGRREFDAVAALVLSAFLVFSAARIIMVATRQIMDVRLPLDEEEVIQGALRRYEGQVVGFHKLRTRRSGHQRYVELHLIVDPKRSVEEIHTVCDGIEGDIQERLPGAEVTIHVEPDDGRPRRPRGSFS
ncbi:MAG: cation diffusion facilitator family transporter [Dehalococcoidia bacterium]|nr:cation diffusion facilitator family transporter [Dehalococcoidia bacterium]